MRSINTPNLGKRRQNLNIRKQQGVVAIMMVLSLAALIGFVGLALDLGKLFVTKSELQNSADACALAAARELTGASTNQLTLAEAAGIAAGISNNVQFQNNPVTVNADDVTFSDTLNGAYLTKDAVANALTMRFARCTVQRTGIVNWFMQVLGAGDQQVNATAVASLVPGQTTCAVPAGVCQADVAAAAPGTWLQGVLGPKGDLTGGFKWIDYSPPGGGASELSDLLTGTGACNLPAVGSIVGQGGVISSLSKAWNSRFGIYRNPVEDSPGQPGFAVPDKTGFAYTEVTWPSKFNAFSDFATHRGSPPAAYQGDGVTGLKAQVGGAITVDRTFLQQHGADRRLATVAVVDCDVLDAGGPTAPVLSWACILMLHPINSNSGGSGTGADRMYVEYLGQSNDPLSPCASSGTVGGPGSVGPLVPALVQ
ncbi:Putative Flp pilus-assembly TadE/G-like [Nitrosomonas ureae]|uniref:Flp pilus-assembly TadE/G-like n=1 Tax=Nitrosomonas ureae TaxID=44577 RepID=A0A285BXU7_9PROT|nr:pilus assembly protein TadG-related protein [Nitrosomonas ureae]SNX60121.1 Putative Flp pilus-assembly TadE/G-like [Nitrosomonas ureae]